MLQLALVGQTPRNQPLDTPDRVNSEARCPKSVDGPPLCFCGGHRIFRASGLGSYGGLKCVSYLPPARNLHDQWSGCVLRR